MAENNHDMDDDWRLPHPSAGALPISPGGTRQFDIATILADDTAEEQLPDRNLKEVLYQQNVSAGFYNLQQGPGWTRPMRFVEYVNHMARCNQCKEQPQDFQEMDELRRHIEVKHRGMVRKWVCRDPNDYGIPHSETPDTPLKTCEPCAQHKQYSFFYNAADHLRRQHFKVKPQKSATAQAAGQIKIEEEREKRRGNGAASDGWPSLGELSLWIVDIDVPMDQHNALVPRTTVPAVEVDDAQDEFANAYHGFHARLPRSMASAGFDMAIFAGIGAAFSSVDLSEFCLPLVIPESPKEPSDDFSDIWGFGELANNFATPPLANIPSSSQTRHQYPTEIVTPPSLLPFFDRDNDFELLDPPTRQDKPQTLIGPNDGEKLEHEMPFTDSGYATAPIRDARSTTGLRGSDKDNSDTRTYISAATTVVPEGVQCSILEVCDDIYNRVKRHVEEDNRSVFDGMPDLIKEFAIRLNHLDPSGANRRIMHFVYSHHR